MRYAKCRIAHLALLPLLIIASGCGGLAKTRPAFPSAIDLKAEPKPVPTEAIITSAIASEEYNASVESWGDRGWLQVSRLCKWAKDMGMRDAPC